MPTADADLDTLVRQRLRSYRQALGWSLDELAERSHLSPSTISRVETGKRTLSLDVLAPLARALQIDVNALLDAGDGDDDVVIRPLPSTSPGRTTWPLSRPTSGRMAMKVRLEPDAPPGEPRVHAGHDWLFVLSGRVRLTLGDRQIDVAAGEAAEFACDVPHAFAAVDDVAELILLFERDGQRAHGGSVS